MHPSVLNKPTSNPTLVVGTACDRSTPCQDAQAMATELADARLLTNTGCRSVPEMAARTGSYDSGCRRVDPVLSPIESLGSET
ncbi:alpha/beta hydrolase [Streptomyces sp. NPDC059371]|uniref:alpha/beta hydrolase n=1 Tax=Streptomyces sp. NPDC059371 TaxID=3346812 RepID=UPI0036C3C324